MFLIMYVKLFYYNINIFLYWNIFIGSYNVREYLYPATFSQFYDC